MGNFYDELVGKPGWDEGLAEAKRRSVFGSNLRMVREELGLTQVDVAARASVDQGDLSRLELGKWGKRGVSYEMLDRVLPVLGLRLEHRVAASDDASPSTRTLEALDVMSSMLESPASSR